MNISTMLEKFSKKTHYRTSEFELNQQTKILRRATASD